ncbi:MAG: hypothetical protein E7214_04685 [Clostridium sp.]|nr:hypothetical protein [Clostridium sp.]
MKKIIFLGEKIYSLKKKHGLYCISKDIRKISKEYYNTNGEKIEVIYIKYKEELLSIKNIHEEDVIIIPIEDKLDETFSEFKGKVYNLYNVEDDFVFKVDDIIILLSALEKVKNRKILCNMIGIGCGEFPISSIVIQILKRINLIENSRKCSLKLLVGKELNIDEISYLEDPLKEYLGEGLELLITQEINNKIKGKIYFSLIGE